MSIFDIQWRNIIVAYPADVTEACQRFSDEQQQLLKFVRFVSYTVSRADDSLRDVTAPLFAKDDSETAEAEYLKTMEHIKTKGAAVKFAQHLRMWLEMLFCRQVDNYLTYIAELLAVVFRTRPEMLKSAETIRIEDVLKHTSMEALIAELTDRKVNSLSYRGMKDLHQYLEKRLS